MPFQISLHSKVNPRGVINSFTAGTDTYDTCAAQITLTATVDGNLTGHTVLWEQVSGDTQIVWLTPTNQVSVTFAVVGGGSSDRLFRFYIDKGTPLEQFDDVTSWGTPTEITPTPYRPVTAQPTYDQACRDVSCGSVYVWYAFPAPSVQGSAIVDPTTGFELTWTVPTCDSQYLTSTVISHNNLGVVDVLATVLPLTYPSISIPDVHGIYYIRVNYTVGNETYTQNSCRFQQPSLPNTSVAYTTDTFGSYSNTSVQQLTYFELIQELVEEEYQLAYSTPLGTAISVIYYELISEVYGGDEEGAPTVINNITASYLSNNGIGG